ncbi:MAG: hypothetical protein JKY65_33885 [Planctomycetes bacterium]|nr:hypothetical protein [Planctomycetota bacterium]
MSLQIYKILHMGGFACLFLALGGMASHAMTSVASEGEVAPRPKLFVVLHGIGLVLLLVAGFGALIKLGIKGVPPWAGGKLVIWLLLGASPMLFKRKPEFAKPLLIALPLFGFGAAILANYQFGG